MSPNHDPTNNRPPTISELAERAQQDLYDPSLPLKHWLRTAEAHKRAAEDAEDNRDLETAFMEYVKATTLVVDKIPSHSEYRTVLNSLQRKNLGLHGSELLNNLGEIKKALVDRYNIWEQKQTQSSSRHPTPAVQHIQPQFSRGAGYSPGAITPVSSSSPVSTSSSHRSRTSASAHGHSARTPSPLRNSGDEDIARRAREDAIARDEGRRREEDRSRYGPGRVEGSASLNQQDWARAEQMRIEREHAIAAQEQEAARRRQQEERMREEELRRRVEEKRKQEQDGIARRQQESEAALRTARRGTPSNNGGGIRVGMPQPAANLAMPHPASSASPVSAPLLQMPLESPTRPIVTAPKPARTPIQPPITTTSPPPSSMGAIQYPSLMSQHQMSQGYTPSLGSMFRHPPMPHHNPNSSGLLIFPGGGEPSSSGLYSNLLPKPSTPVQTSHYPMQAPSPYQPPPPSRPPLPPPPPMHHEPSHHRQDSARIQPSAADPVNHNLKNVNFPRDCLHRFLSIAAVNTSMNRETCGLLLGKDKGSKYVVTTLLVPKQHSTSDTCTMDEEELVMMFTEERSLITLGWIHTHPTQSCFMSSVDLHTHSGFQRMLPESFAVVCAPKSTPNFGIFRLTDPPGLSTILECTAKEAFHPHPNVPIYTDADKGHVQIKDLPLEIVDLRL